MVSFKPPGTTAIVTSTHFGSTWELWLNSSLSKRSVFPERILTAAIPFTLATRPLLLKRLCPQYLLGSLHARWTRLNLTIQPEESLRERRQSTAIKSFLRLATMSSIPNCVKVQDDSASGGTTLTPERSSSDLTDQPTENKSYFFQNLTFRVRTLFLSNISSLAILTSKSTPMLGRR